MLRKLSVIAFAISVFAVFAQPEVQAQTTRVNFTKGSSSGTVRSTIKGASERNFVLGAAKGQEIKVEINSKNGNVRVQDEDGKIEVAREGGLTKNTFDAISGDNIIRIYNISTVNEDFTAVFTITNSSKKAPTRVSFKKGASSATLNLKIAGDGEREVVLGAEEGQEIRVKITSKNNAVLVEGEGGLTENIFDAVDGDNVIRIYNDTNRSVNFTAIFTIKTLVNQPATRVNFDKGKFSKTIKLAMSGSENSKRFVIRANANQTVNIKIGSEWDSQRITMNLENGVDGKDEWVDGQGYLIISTGRNGDFIFTVRKADDSSFATNMKVFIGNDN